MSPQGIASKKSGHPSAAARPMERPKPRRYPVALIEGLERRVFLTALPSPNVITGTAANDTFFIMPDPTGTRVIVAVGSQVYPCDPSQPITLKGGGGSDTLVLNQQVPAHLDLRGSFVMNFAPLSSDQGLTLDESAGISTLSVRCTDSSPLAAIQSYLRDGQIRATGLATNQSLADTYRGSSIFLAPLLDGDTSQSGTVGFSQLLALAQNYGKANQDWAHGDLNYDGVVNFQDLLALAQHYGQSSHDFIANLADRWDYGNIDQNSPGIDNGNVACGPTSVVNSFIYLENRYGLDGLIPHTDGNTPEEDAIDTVNKLEQEMQLDPNDGVTDPNFINGKIDYINEVGLGDEVSVESQSKAVDGTTPTAEFLYEQLAKGQDVEVGISWNSPDGGGHWVTATGMDFDTETGTGTLDFIDPWGGEELHGSLSLDEDGNLVLSYSGGAAGGGGPSIDGGEQDPDNQGDASSGTIDIIVAESPKDTPITLTQSPATLPAKLVRHAMASSSLVAAAGAAATSSGASDGLATSNASSALSDDPFSATTMAGKKRPTRPIDTVELISTANPTPPTVG